MFHRIMPAIFQNIIKADHIALYVCIWINNRVTDTRLSSKIDHNIRVILLKDAVNKRFVCKIPLDKGVVFEFLEFSQTCFFDSDIVVVIHVIKTNDLSIWFCGQDTLGKIRADEPGCASDKSNFAHIDSFPYHQLLFSPHHLIDHAGIALDDLYHLIRHILIGIIRYRDTEVAVLVHLDRHIHGLQQTIGVDAR